MATPTAQQKKEQEKQALYVELHKFCQNQDDDRASKVASKILHLFPNDEVAFQTKIVCHINRTWFHEALILIKETPKLAPTVQYEKAYCYYRLQQMQEAKEVLDNWKDNSFKKQELLYQIHYRLDLFEEAYDMLSDLIKNSADEMDDERQTNLAALEASLKLVGSDKRVKAVDGDSYELLYNRAVGLIGDGQVIEAEALLRKSEGIARASLTEEGATEDDISDELALIQSQHAFCLQILGRVKEALGIYGKVLKDKPSDLGLVAVISNNILCGNKDCSIFDSKKRLRVMTAEDILPKLNKLQKKDMLLNECLFDLHIHNTDETKRLCGVVETKYPDLAEDVLMIRCCLKTWTDNILEAKKEFVPSLQKGSETWLNINLALVQLALENEFIDPAIDFLRDLGEHYYRPGIISAVVTLYHHRGMIDKAGNVLKDAVEYYRKSGSNKENMRLLWRQTASFLMAQGDHEGAVKSLEELRKATNDDPLILAQLIVAYSQIDVEKAKSLSKLLPPVSPTDLDAAGLESPNWLTHVKVLRKGIKNDSVTTPAKSVSTAGDAGGKEKNVKKKKKKKAKLPANYDIARQPDPERWLPKYERSGYRPKKTRKGRVDVGKGTQGADSATSAIYDMSGKIGQKADESPATTSGGWKKDQHKKKKRKK